MKFGREEVPNSNRPSIHFENISRRVLEILEGLVVHGKNLVGVQS